MRLYFKNISTLKQEIYDEILKHLKKHTLSSASMSYGYHVSQDYGNYLLIKYPEHLKEENET